MTATEVSRSFSATLNRVDSGEEITIVRNGRPVAELRRPARPAGLSGAELKDLLASLPAPDERFARETVEARRRLGPPAGKWPGS